MAISSRGKPAWLKIRPPDWKNFPKIKETIKKYQLHTVCEESHCPNISECWSGGTATFLILGDVCTRGCRFCQVNSAAKGKPVDAAESKKIAAAVKEWNLKYAVLTSVARDDLPDYGSEQFVKCVREIKNKMPGVIVEVLIPDFQGEIKHLKKIVAAEPDVIAHNIETVERLQAKVRDGRAGYRQSLSVLKNVKKIDKKIFTKSSLLVGFGETEKEILQTMKDLRAADADFLAIGQYLRPSEWHLPVVEYIKPEKFSFLKKVGEEMGFASVASGPFVRTSYKAFEFFEKASAGNSIL